MSDSMKAAVLASPRHVHLQEVPLPKPSPNQVRVRLEGSGVCGSDLALWQGRDWFDYPREPGAPGHEGWGIVDALGEGVTQVDVGDRVAGLFHHAYAEFDVASADELVPVPDALHKKPFPGEPLACAVNAFHRSGISEGDRVAVVGTGFIGALLVGLAAQAGATVVGISRRGFSLKAAETMGAQHVVGLDDGDPVEEVQRLFDGALCDVAIEATGKQAPLDLATKLTRIRGRLVIAGYHQEGQRQVDMQLWNWRGLDVINAHERDPQRYVQGMREAARLVAEGRLDPSPLYTHEVPLQDIGQAFRAMEERPDGFLKAVVRA